MPCTVNIPSPLRSYTEGAASVLATVNTMAEILADIERHPGMRFRMIDEQVRIRQQLRIFVNTDPALQLTAPVQLGDTVQVICALSGG